MAKTPNPEELQTLWVNHERRCAEIREIANAFAKALSPAAAERLQQATGLPSPQRAAEATAMVLLADDTIGGTETIESSELRQALGNNESQAERIIATGRTALNDTEDNPWDTYGPRFHQLTANRNDGSFYTKTTSAILLAEIITGEGRTTGEDEGCTVIDPACGTGALLLALDHRRRGNNLPTKTVGVDVNRWGIAIAQGHPASPKSEREWHSTELGLNGTDDTATAGSLEALLAEEAPGLAPESADIVVMNAPYTRHSVRHGHRDEVESRALRKREQTIRSAVEDPDLRTAIDGTSLSTYFTALAHRVAKPNATIAMIRPFSVNVGPSSGGERDLLAKRTRIARVITMHDPRHPGLSASTSIAEAIVVTTKGEPEPNRTVEFITVAENPQNAGTATEIGRAIRKELAHPQIRRSEVSQRDLGSHPWTDASLHDPVLRRAYRTDLRDSEGCRPVGDLVQGMTAPAAIRLQFAATERLSEGERNDENGGHHAIWHQTAQNARTVVRRPDRRLTPRNGKQRYAHELWTRRGVLLLAEKLQWRRSRATALLSPVATLGGSWTPVQCEAALAKALTVWFNSSAGVLAHAALRSRNLTYPAYSLTIQRLLPAPSDGGTLLELAEAFEELRRLELKPLAALNDDPNRWRFDRAVARAMPDLADRLREWRKRLAAEPTIREAG